MTVEQNSGVGMTGLAADRRTFLKGLGLLGAATLVPGCGSSSKSPGGADAGEQRSPGQKVQLVFWSWVPGVDKAVSLWNSQNPDVQVKLENIPAGSSGG